MLLSFPLIGLGMWAYDRWRPERDGRACAVYDATGWTLYMAACHAPRSHVIGGPVVSVSALGFGFMYEPPVLLVIAWVARNQLIFRAPANGRPRQ